MAQTKRMQPGPAPAAASPGSHILTSPIVGTFSRAPSPDAGVVAEIYPQNAQAVEFGEPLFAIRTTS